MTPAQHFGSVSGGKDSEAVLCVMRERMDRRPTFRPRLQFCDVDNENQITLDHIDYLDDWAQRTMGIAIEKLSAYDVPGLIDDVAFERKRQSIRENWPKELRRVRHTTECAAARAAIPKLAKGCRHSPERAAAIKAWAKACECPVVVSPPMPDWRIQQAIAELYSRGNAFLDMCLIHGRFPSKMAKFCTDELKIQPLMQTRQPLWDAGIDTVDWIGERAQESKSRALKPVLERFQQESGAYKVQYRPIKDWDARDTFVIAKKHGLKPNPLYRLGASRVGCWPCHGCQKEEIALVAKHTPTKIDDMREWERLVSIVGRRDYEGDGSQASFFSADKVPGDPDDWTRARIDNVIAWSKTTRGGKQFDMMAAIDAMSDEDVCSAIYPIVCE